MNGRSEHIAFVCPRFADERTVGGAETLLRKLAERTAAAGRRVSFLTTCARDHFTWENVVSPGIRREAGMDVHFFPVDEDRNLGRFQRLQSVITRGGKVTEAQQEQWLRDSVGSTALYRHVEETVSDYDCIVAGPYLYGLVCFVARICPDKTLLVPCLHDEPFAYLAPIRAMFQEVAGFMFNSAPEQDLARRLYDIEASRCSVVGMGLDAFECEPGAFAARHGLTRPYVVYSGRREELKGTPLLVEYMDVFRRRTGRDIALVLTGSGRVDVLPSMRDWVLDVGIVSPHEKEEAMAGGLVFCLPSVNESFGIVILESWLAGTPVLVHAHSDVLRFHCVRSGGGLWFRNYPEFEAELLLLLDDAPMRARLARTGRAYVLEEYSWAAIDARLLRALDELVP